MPPLAFGNGQRLALRVPGRLPDLARLVGDRGRVAIAVTDKRNRGRIREFHSHQIVEGEVALSGGSILKACGVFQLIGEAGEQSTGGIEGGSGFAAQSVRGGDRPPIFVVRILAVAAIGRVHRCELEVRIVSRRERHALRLACRSANWSQPNRSRSSRSKSCPPGWRHVPANRIAA